MQAHDILCLHTMAGTFSGTNTFFHNNGYGGTESHYGIAGSGHARQWQDTDFQADANLDGNPRVISFETADRGETFPLWEGSDVPPWTPQQIDTIVALLDWHCSTYDIPRELVPDSRPGRRGIAYHRQGIDPWRVSGGELWSSARGKVCPGDARIHQLTTIVIPRLRGEDMSLDANDEAVIVRACQTALKLQYRLTLGIGGDPNADAVGARVVIEAARAQGADTARLLVAVGGVDEEVVAKLTTLSEQISGSVADRLVPIIQAQIPAESMDPAELRQLVRDEAEAAVREVAADAASPG